MHGGIANNVKVNIEWIDSELFEQEDAAVEALHHVSGILVPGGFGERGSEGKIRAVRLHVSKISLFGICLDANGSPEGRPHVGLAGAGSVNLVT